MDLIKQNRFIGWVIATLVILNVVTVTLIWSLSLKPGHGPAKSDSVSSPPDPILLMQREIGLTDDQAEEYQRLREKHKGDMRAINDELDALKLRMADEIFSSQLDENQIQTLAAKIGILQSELETQRFNHFRELALICNEEQKAKLHPILRQVFGKKGASDRPTERPGALRRQQPQQETKEKRSSESPAPANKEERMNRLRQRLALSQEQVKMVEGFMDSTRIKEEEYKSIHRPDRNEFDQQKEIFRRQENDHILGILNPQQKQEFLKMQQKRRK